MWAKAVSGGNFRVLGGVDGKIAMRGRFWKGHGGRIGEMGSGSRSRIYITQRPPTLREINFINAPTVYAQRSVANGSTTKPTAEQSEG